MSAERRQDPRFPFTMKVYRLDSPGRALETSDLSAGGAYLVGDIGADVGATVWLRLELSTSRQGRESLYPLDAEVQVMRVSRDSEGSVAGCGVRWLSVSCEGDMAPLRHFLKAILSIGSGFVQAQRPEDESGTPIFVFVFPQRGLGGEESAEPSAPSGPVRTGIYVLLPITYQIGDAAPVEARAIKLLPHAMRVATDGELPDPYRRVTVRIAIKDGERSGTLELAGTVTTVRRGSIDGQFEVEFSLGNSPEAVASYRKMVDNLSQSLQKPA